MERHQLAVLHQSSQRFLLEDALFVEIVEDAGLKDEKAAVDVVVSQRLLADVL
jgi:hypothetical protein